METPISIEQQIDAVDFAQRFFEAGNYDDKQDTRKIQDDLKAALSTLRASQWISVKEEKPHDKHDVFEVLVKVDEPFWGKTEPRMIVAYYDSESGQWRCELTSREIYHVTHWMPLPSPPLTPKP